MDSKFNLLPWHDAVLSSVSIDRSDAGKSDTVALTIKWPDGHKNDVVFNDCYFLCAMMNFGVIAEESILEGVCFSQSDRILEIKSKWQSLGVELGDLRGYRLITNSTNSRIEIYALSYALL